MSEQVQLAIIAALIGALPPTLGVIMAWISLQNKWLDLRERGKHLANKMETIEKHTNGMTEQIAKLRGDAQFIVGKAEGVEEQRLKQASVDELNKDFDS